MNNSNIIISICTFMNMLLLIVAYFSKKRIDSAETKLYSAITLISFTISSIEIISYLVLKFFSYNSFSYILLMKIILLCYFLWVLFFLTYVYIITYGVTKDMFFKTKYAKFALFILIISSFIVIISPLKFEHLDGLYIPSGFTTFFVYFMSGFCDFILLLIVIINRKKVWDRKYIPIFILFVCGLFVVVFQMFNPQYFLISALLTLTTFVMYFTIENPDVKMIEQLEYARETADKANKSKTEFLSSMSHEIRTPLNAIVGFSDCIMEASTLDEAKENAKDIVNASGTLLEIVNGILDISKIEAGKLEIVNSKYNALEVFTELAKLITPRMRDKGLDFTYHIDPTLPKVLYGDHASIKKIVTNLLSNACKYTEHGFVHYDVSCVRMGDYVRLIISVEDSGRGIKKESIDKLFTKFQRLDEDRNTTIEGTGLGLAITKQLAELMGGKIICHTIYGEGSKFTAVLNQRIESNLTIDSEVKEELDDYVDLSGVRILIVDDTPLNIKVASKLLQRYNANMIDSCSSGFDCINKIKSGNKYDLILLDDMMPKLSGTETLQKLKEIPGFNIFTVALTANALTGMKEKYISSGFDDYLSKPIERMELVRVANKLLGGTSDNDVEVKEDIIENNEEKDKVVPVEDNIEEILGSQLDLSERTSNTQILTQLEKDIDIDKEEVELLDDEPEIISTDIVDTPELIPIADINITLPNEEKYDTQYLEKNGCDIKAALGLLGDISMYNSTICDFLTEIDEKWNRIVESKDSGDMDNYSIDVHSLKSDCKYLGFLGLADIAYQHELKSKEKDLDFVRNDFSKLENEYNRIIEVIKNYAKDNPSE